MENKMKRIILLLIAIALVCTGCATAKGDAYSMALYRAAAPEEGTTTYVIGHKAPDTDTVASAIAYAKLKTALGFPSVPVISGKLNNETKFVLDYFKVETPEILDSAAGKTMIMVDHATIMQAIDGMDKANVIEVLDHHPIAGFTSPETIIYKGAPIGATASMVYHEYKVNHVRLDKVTAGLLAAAIMSDTSNLKKERTTDIDRKYLEELCKRAGIQKPKAFYKAMNKAGDSYVGMTDKEIVEGNCKVYDFSGHHVAVAGVDWLEENDLPDFVARMEKAMANAYPKLGVEHFFVKLDVDTDVEGKEDYTIFLYYGDGAEKIALKCFPTMVDGHIVTAKLNRSKDIVPALTEAYKKEL